MHEYLNKNHFLSSEMFLQLHKESICEHVPETKSPPDIKDVSTASMFNETVRDWVSHRDGDKFDLACAPVN
jgi:hypothetical protein